MLLYGAIAIWVLLACLWYYYYFTDNIKYMINVLYGMFIMWIVLIFLLSLWGVREYEYKIKN